MAQTTHGYLVRGLLGLLALVMLVFTLPAYMDPSSNPGLANLSGEAATIGSVAGAFLARQLGLALIALYGALRGSTEALMIGAFGIAFLNLHDAVFLTVFGTFGVGAIAGLILGGLGVLVMVMTFRASR